MSEEKKSKKVKVLIFGNGNIAAFGPDGQQIPELQAKSVNTFLCERAEKLGYDPEKFEVEYYGGFKSQPFRTSEGDWNHRGV